MITVKEAVNVLKKAKTIVLGYGDNAIYFNPDDVLMMDAYGSYCVDRICSVGNDDDYYEIDIAVRPIRAGE